ncbi:LysR family transcriptional regulator [Streptomyces huiliensis]|uniref:LysR family transcriptional regulator n=1 Tax=Streptomyces huiliensis TaxID=2876027 RepID=UPI001CBD3DB3|nr:LysR family transcriptional regulator [Streptomyces huiliensis]MBZ4322963.1 LysR family transcriptional regulator [Streptomyces huiliensis]
MLGVEGEPGEDALAGVELRQLRYFAAVAEAGTVTEAARRLRIAQPSLSQQIRRLERRVGTPLFRRLPHGMEPTEAGRLLLEGTGRAFDELRSSLAAARAVPLTTAVGVCRGVPQSVLATAEEIMASGRRPRFAYRQAESGRQGELLRQGTLAFGILRGPVDTSGLTVRALADEPLGVLLHARHPLAERPELVWSDLSDQRLLWFPSERAPGYAAEVLAHAAARGWTPETLVDSDGGHSLFRHRLIGDDGLVALRTRAGSLGDPDLVWRPVGPEPPRERLLLAAAARTPWARLVAAGS